MTKTTRRILALGIVLSLVSGVLGGASEQDTTLKQIAGYREWTRLNEKPISVVDYSSGGGWSVVVSDWRVGDAPYINSSQGTTKILLPGAVVNSGSLTSSKAEAAGVHEGSSIGHVYANRIAHQAILTNTTFPQGSILVREKFAPPTAASPELLAVMAKRAPGFNRAGGDWEFLTLDGLATKIQKRQKKGSCLQCHLSEKAHDFVFPVLAGN